MDDVEDDDNGSAQSNDGDDEGVTEEADDSSYGDVVDGAEHGEGSSNVASPLQEFDSDTPIITILEAKGRTSSQGGDMTEDPVAEERKLTYMDYLLLLPNNSTSDDDDYANSEQSIVPFDKHEFEDESADSVHSNVEEDWEDRGMYEHRLMMHHREAFYKAYTPVWNVASKSSHLINRVKYDEIVALLRTPRQKNEPSRCVKYRRLYQLSGNVEGRCLYRVVSGKKLKAVPTFENVYDVILEAHAKTEHAKGAYLLYC